MQKVQLTKEAVESLYNSKKSYQEIAQELGLSFPEGEDGKKIRAESLIKIKGLFSYFDFPSVRRPIFRKETSRNNWFEIIDSPRNEFIEEFDSELVSI